MNNNWKYNNVVKYTKMNLLTNPCIATAALFVIYPLWLHFDHTLSLCFTYLRLRINSIFNWVIVMIARYFIFKFDTPDIFKISNYFQNFRHFRHTHWYFR